MLFWSLNTEKLVVKLFFLIAKSVHLTNIYKEMSSYIESKLDFEVERLKSYFLVNHTLVNFNNFIYPPPSVYQGFSIF